MKRYLLFAGKNHYPLGGWEDFVDEAVTWEYLLTEVKKETYDWFHLYDNVLNEVVIEKVVNGYGDIYFSSVILPLPSTYYKVLYQRHGAWVERFAYYQNGSRYKGWTRLDHLPLEYEVEKYRELTMEELDDLMEDQGL